MKFILTIYFCSLISQQCSNGITNKIEYNNYKDCIYDGYAQSIILLDEYPINIINEYRILTKFNCIEQTGKGA